MKLPILLALMLSGITYAHGQKYTRIDSAVTNDPEFPRKKLFYNFGKLRVEAFFDVRGTTAKTTLYYRNGKKQSETTDRDTCIYVSYYKNGQMKTQVVITPDGYQKYSKDFKRNGKLKEFSPGPGYTRQIRNSAGNP